MRRFAKRISSALGIIRTFENWPLVVFDNLGARRTTYRARLRNGLSYRVRPGTDDARILFEIFVKGCYRDVVVKSDSTVIDIGANTGVFSIMVGRTAARVIACEPHPANLAILRENLQFHNLSSVEIVDLAIAGSSGTTSLVIPDNDSYTGRYSLHPGRGTRSIQITCTTLDELVSRLGVGEVDLLKIDCQGSEYEILYGASDALLLRTKQIIVECEDFPDHPTWSPAGLTSHLTRSGFMVSARGNILYAHRSGPAEAPVKISP